LLIAQHLRLARHWLSRYQAPEEISEPIEGMIKGGLLDEANSELRAFLSAVKAEQSRRQGRRGTLLLDKIRSLQLDVQMAYASEDPRRAEELNAELARVREEYLDLPPEEQGQAETPAGGVAESVAEGAAELDVAGPQHRPAGREEIEAAFGVLGDDAEFDEVEAWLNQRGTTMYQ